MVLPLELGMDLGTCRARGAMAALPGLQDRRGPRPVVARHQWHPPRLPLVSDPGERAHHHLEVGGGLPSPIGVRADAPPPVLDKDLEAGAPSPPSKMQAPATLRWGCQGMRMTPKWCPWARPPCSGRSRRQRSGCTSRAKTSAWTSHASWVQGEQGTPALLPRGVPISLAATFCLLGVDVAIKASRLMGPVLSRRLEAGQSALRRLPHLSTYERRERAISTLVTLLVLQGAAVASVTDPDVRRLETAVAWALWGAKRLSRARQIVFTVPSKGNRVFLIMQTRDQRLLWLARMA